MKKNAKKASKHNSARLGNLLDGILSRLGLAHKLGGWRVAANWDEIVGESIAKASHAVKFDNETLLVSVPDAVWRQQLSLEVDAILEKIHSFPGGKAVRKIHFVA